MKTEDRERHRWDEIEDLLEKCKYCGAFRAKKAFVHTGSLKHKGKGNWVFKYSRKGSSKWLDSAPECI